MVTDKELSMKREEAKEKREEAKEKEKREWETLLTTDKQKNPYLAVIAEHLFWMSLLAKISIIIIAIGIFTLIKDKIV